MIYGKSTAIVIETVTFVPNLADVINLTVNLVEFHRC